MSCINWTPTSPSQIPPLNAAIVKATAKINRSKLTRDQSELLRFFNSYRNTPRVEKFKFYLVISVQNGQEGFRKLVGPGQKDKEAWLEEKQ